MIELGKKIAYYRKRMNLTQSELGEKLNVTAQAVSKWENGISDPDLHTLHRLSKLFGVSTDELISEENPQPNTTADADLPQEEEQPVLLAEKVQEPEEETSEGEQSDPAENGRDSASPETVAAASPIPAGTPAPVGTPTPAGTPPGVAAYCTRCKRAINQNEKYSVTTHRGGSQTILCPQCQKAIADSEKRSALFKEERAFKLSMIWGSVAGGAIFLLFTILAIVYMSSLPLIGYIFAVQAFFLVAQLFWGEFLAEFVLFFFRSFQMPGLIFTLDLDGIIWLITVKIGLAVLSAILSVFVAIFGIFAGMLVSTFTFPFAIVKERRKIAKLRKEVHEIKA